MKFVNPQNDIAFKNNLLDVLDDATIAAKSGLPVEEIGQLRVQR